MKTKLLATLLGGLLSTGFAMASTSAPSYTLLTSSNLAGNYTIADSGFVSNSDRTWLGNSDYVSSTTSTALGSAFQDSLGQWYQPTEFVTMESYDFIYQNFTQDTRSIVLRTTANVTNSFLDLTVNTSSPLTYSVYAYGVTGSTTSPRGFTQVVNPSLGLVIDGQQVSSSTTSSTGGYFDSWSGIQHGAGSSSFQAVAEASSGGYITSLDLYLYADKVLGTIAAQTYSYETDRFMQDVAIAAPVPEPETYAMMLAGLGMMGAVARRRKKAQN